MMVCESTNGREDTLRFAELTVVRPVIESYPLEKAAEAFAKIDDEQGGRWF